MNPQKSTMSVLAQISSLIPDRIVDNLAKKHKIQTRAFSANSHVMAMFYAHLAHSLNMNDICDSLHNHAGPLAQIRNCTPLSRNSLSHANKPAMQTCLKNYSGQFMSACHPITRGCGSAIN